MEFAARNMKITLPADHAVDAEIDFGPEGGAFSLAARLYVSLPGMERATAERLIEATHEVCPYSRATHANIAIETTLLWAAPMKADSDRLIAAHTAQE
jgi:organic hydroperoxide reductase OsmC/OhrA